MAARFRPELILCSAGYDAHWRNSTYVAGIRMAVTVSGFACWVALIRDLAGAYCPGRLAFCLEGGYDCEALARSVDATLRVLLGEEAADPLGRGPATMPEPDLGPLLAEVRRMHGLE